MSTKKSSNDSGTRRTLRGWFNDLTFLKKFVIIYLICAALPMLVMSGYAYQQTSFLLMDEALSSMSQSMTALENSLNYTFRPFETISRTLTNDRLLNTQMSLDYTNLSYSDIAYYQNTTINELEGLNPGLILFSN